ncbi:ATP/GTP-binding protein [Streptomyces sp. NPDC054904]|uniref:ATP/GTP-binding protein n=1 Tax=unclassified Streptomyces TaxID=2593676 RepID=UPI002481A19B|nr:MULTISPECIES: ATP/GTP-binding protein [unclassified Streptomyces]MDA5285171.1 ATP/GTP-binding protein [Streptomyces sp. Isolate_45]MDX2392208.1 ATP/GTP-binding protein [Streptomyces sp. DK15]
MSPRHNRPRGGETPDERPGTGLDRFGLERTEEYQGEEWKVRHVAGAAAAGKRYRCPGCDQEIPSGTPHLVAWPEYGGVDDRRHWHKACWNAKDRRTTKVQRSRNAPKY